MSGLFHHSRISLYAFVALLLFFLGFNLTMISPYLLVILMGTILALMTHPLYFYLREHHFKRQVSAGLVTLIIILLVLGPLIGFFSIALNQGITLAQELAQSDFQNLNAMVVDRISHWEPVRFFLQDPAVVKKQIQSGIQSFGSATASAILTFAGDVPEILLKLALTLITCYFLLVDGKRFLDWLSLRLPLDIDVRLRLFRSFKETAVSVIWANLAAATAQSVLMIVGFLLLGIPGASIAGVATFIFSWIPILGSVPVALVGTIYLYTQDSIGKMIAMLALAVFIGIIDNIIRPVVLKGRQSMHPLVSLVAIFGGISMFGVLGVFFGPILASILIVLLQIWPVIGQRFGLTFDGAEIESRFERKE